MDLSSSAVRERRSSSPSGEHRNKKAKIEKSSNNDPSDASAAKPVPVLARENSVKLSAVLKPPPTAASTASVTPAPLPEIAIEVDNAEDASFRAKELAKWSAKAVQTIPPYTLANLSDEAIIRRKLMFEAGNPPASSHRGIKLLAGNVGVLVKCIRDRRPEEDVDTVAQRVQLYIQQEELTLTRLAVGCESVASISDKETRLPDELRASLLSVQEQIEDQKERLEEANKTELLFAGYVESANRIRKLESYDELVKQRNRLKEETKRLKDEKARLDRQQQEKLPYLVIANWALKNLHYGEGWSARPPAAGSGGLAEPQHHSKSTSKHKKSPKKSAKEPKST